MISHDLLGQNLFREAICDRSLEPFEVAAEDMYDLDIPLRCRADIFKAVRFGLAGVAIHGWQERVTVPLSEPYELGGRIVGYRFSPEYFPIEDAFVAPSCETPEWDQTSGWLSLERLRTRSEEAMQDLLDDPEAHVAGISLSEVQSSLLKHVIAAEELGILEVPNMYNGGKPLHLNIYNSYGPYCIDSIRFALEGSTGSLITETVNGISACMREVAKNKGHLSDNTDYALTLVTGVLQHASRASQRQDGFHTTVSDDDYPDFTLVNRNGEDELLWKSKYRKPPRRLEEGELPTLIHIEDIFEANLRRNKCPAGYTAQATETMPIKKVCDGVIIYMIESGLDDPMLFAAKSL